MIAVMIKSHDCPKCGCRLERSGELTLDGQPVPLAIFQCDDCVESVEVEGEPFDMALTFAVTGDGQLLDALRDYAPLDLAK